MQFFKLLRSDIRERNNLEYYIVLVIIIFVFILDIVGIASDEILFEAILASLAVILYGFIDNKHKNDKIENTLTQLNVSTDISKRFFKVGYSFDEIGDALTGSKKAYFWGYTFTKTIAYLAIPSPILNEIVANFSRARKKQPQLIICMAFAALIFNNPYGLVAR